jgi:hypothetical protein
MENRTRNVPVELPGFGQIKVQAIVSAKEQDVSNVKDVMSWGDVNKTIEGIATTLKATMDKVAPDKASVEFGIALELESGKLSALLVQGTASSSLKITLTWGK